MGTVLVGGSEGCVMEFSVGVTMCGSDGGLGGCSDGDGIFFLLQIDVGWRGYEPEVELQWGIEGQGAQCQRRCYSKVEMKVLRKVVQWVR